MPRAPTCSSSPSSTSPPMRSTTCTCRTRSSTRPRRAIAAIVEASAKLKPVLLVGAALRRNGRLYNCALAIARGRILGVVPKQFLPNYREYYEKRWFASGLGLTGLDIDCRGADRAVRRRPDLRRVRPRGFRLPCRDLRGLLGAHPALDRRRARRGAGAVQSLRLEHRHRQGARARTALRVAIGAHALGLSLLGLRSRREHHRSRLGRPGADLRSSASCSPAPNASS